MKRSCWVFSLHPFVRIAHSPQHRLSRVVVALCCRFVVFGWVFARSVTGLAAEVSTMLGVADLWRTKRQIFGFSMDFLLFDRWMMMLKAAGFCRTCPMWTGSSIVSSIRQRKALVVVRPPIRSSTTTIFADLRQYLPNIANPLGQCHCYPSAPKGRHRLSPTAPSAADGY